MPGSITETSFGPVALLSKNGVISGMTCRFAHSCHTDYAAPADICTGRVDEFGTRDRTLSIERQLDLASA